MSSTDGSVAELASAVRELAERLRGSDARFFELAPSADVASYFTPRDAATHGRSPLEPLAYRDGEELAAALAAMWASEGFAEGVTLGLPIAGAADALRAATAEQDASVSQFIYAMF